MANVSCVPIDYQTIIDLSNKPMPICQKTRSHSYIFYEKLEESAKKCPKLCTTLTYHGSVIHGSGSSNNPRDTVIFFWFASNETQIHQEYQIFDTNGLIGSIGGSLGLFIGFSFHGALKSILVFIKNILIRSKLLS